MWLLTTCVSICLFARFAVSTRTFGKDDLLRREENTGIGQFNPGALFQDAAPRSGRGYTDTPGSGPAAQRLTPQQITDIFTFSPAKIAQLTAAQLAQLTPAQLGQLTEDQVAALTPAHKALLQPDQLAALPNPIDPEILAIIDAGGHRGHYTQEEMQKLLRSPNPSIFCRREQPKPGEKVLTKRVIEKQIGKGGFGTVYSGTYHDLRTTPPKQYTVAFKFQDYTEKTAKPMLREINFMRVMKVSRHHLPFYQCYYDRVRNRVATAGRSPNDQVIMMMELMKGDVMSLVTNPQRRREVFQRKSPGKFMVDMAKGIRDLHWMGAIHRDVKPDNFLLNANLDPIVADLGLTEYLKNGGVSGLCGTPYYIAPEVLEGRLYGQAVDVYALGVTFASFLTAKKAQAFVDFVLPDKDKGVQGRSVVYCGPVKEASPRYLGLIQRMTDPDPARRPNMVEVVKDLENLANKRPSAYQARDCAPMPALLGLPGRGRRLRRIYPPSDERHVASGRII